MNNIILQEQILAKVGNTSQARLTGLPEYELAKQAYLRACEIGGMIEVIKLLPNYQGMVPHLRRHMHWLLEQSEGR